MRGSLGKGATSILGQDRSGGRDVVALLTEVDSTSHMTYLPTMSAMGGFPGAGFAFSMRWETMMVVKGNCEGAREGLVLHIKEAAFSTGDGQKKYIAIITTFSIASRWHLPSHIRVTFLV
jgi:hypothetical protein